MKSWGIMSLNLSILVSVVDSRLTVSCGCHRAPKPICVLCVCVCGGGGGGGSVQMRDYVLISKLQFVIFSKLLSWVESWEIE